MVEQKPEKLLVVVRFHFLAHTNYKIYSFGEIGRRIRLKIWSYNKGIGSNPIMSISKNKTSKSFEYDLTTQNIPYFFLRKRASRKYEPTTFLLFLVLNSFLINLRKDLKRNLK